MLVLGASLCFGAVPFFASELLAAGIAPVAITCARFALGALILLPFLPLSRRDRTPALWAALAGALISLSWIGYVEAIDQLSVATVGVLYMSYPLFTVLLGWLLFRDRPAPRSLFGGGLILMAAAMVAGPAALGGGAPGAVLLALLAPLGFGAAVNILSRRMTDLAPLARVAATSTSAGVLLVPLTLSLPLASILPPDRDALMLLLGLSLVTAVIPQLMYVTGAPHIGPDRAAAAGSIELPTMLVVGWTLLGEPLGPIEILAAALVVSAIVLTPPRPAS
ncbi:MAG: DMT family transporter [Pseudomonadota bacterium]